MGIAGTVLEPPPEGGLALELKSDALFVRMESDALRDGTDNLEGAQADVTRLRLTVEGSRAFALGSDGTLTPAFELGLRHDGGDAETGTGVEVGARLSYTRPGVTVEGAVRALVAHEASGYEEWGASAAVRIDPGESGRGLSLTLTPVWGQAGSGTERLWGVSDARGLAPDTDFEAARRLDAEVGYGFGPWSGVATPYAGLGASDGGARTWRLGQRLRRGPSQWRLESEFAEASRTVRAGYAWRLGGSLDLGVEGSRSVAANDEAEHRIGLTLNMRW